MKTSTILLTGLLFFSLHTQATAPQVLDTLYANENTNTALFFPDAIRQGIAGAENFVFTYNREKGQSLGLLKALPGPDSNLLVVTAQGHVFSFVLKYQKHLSIFHHFIPLQASVGHEKGVQKAPFAVFDTLPIPTGKQKIKPLPSHPLATDCEKLLKLPERMHRSKKKNGLRLSLKNKVYYNDKVFLQFELKNNSGIDFKPTFLDLFIASGTVNRKASYQEIPVKVHYAHNLPKIVQHGNTSRFVLVFDKFTLGRGEKLRIKVWERDGERRILFNYKFL
jgi:hypothetical protein